ncbi:hypothetical protein CEXT_126931 [Caerostris extrusa]|uniref:Uncharacterized protein n=1 Tax=Caerostris extrusa TaxID=172846 RepID=A0AAV4VUB4_CAEEX|nr:hypothetical protein CEXT_126931 [Caerostris extrusa]
MLHSSGDVSRPHRKATPQHRDAATSILCKIILKFKPLTSELVKGAFPGGCHDTLGGAGLAKCPLHLAWAAGRSRNESCLLDEWHLTAVKRPGRC